jgi:hypothetical protein
LARHSRRLQRATHHPLTYSATRLLTIDY